MMANTIREIAGQLRSTLGRMELVLGLVHDCLVWTDASGRIIWCNSAFDRLVERPHVETVGAELIGLLPLWQRGQPVPADEHPAKRIHASRADLSETYETIHAGRLIVVD